MAETLSESQAFESWAILELMGHRKLGGYVKEVNLFGTAMCRIDVPEGDGQPAATQFYTHGAIYAVTVVTEELARRMASNFRPAPVSKWDLPSALPKPSPPVVVEAYARGREETRDIDFGDDEEQEQDDA